MGPPEKQESVTKLGLEQLRSFKELNPVFVSLFVCTWLCLWPPDTHESVTKFGWNQLWSYKELNPTFVVCLFDKGCVCGLLTNTSVTMLVWEQLWSFQDLNPKL